MTANQHIRHAIKALNTAKALTGLNKKSKVLEALEHVGQCLEELKSLGIGED